MSIERKIRVLYTVAIAIMLTLAAVITLTSRHQQQLNNSQEIRFQSHLLAAELRASSDDLTRLARTYVITGDSRYEQMYWDILAVRSGEKPRPDGRTVALRKLMEDIGFTATDFSKSERRKKTRIAWSALRRSP